MVRTAPKNVTIVKTMLLVKNSMGNVISLAVLTLVISLLYVKVR